MNFAETFIRRPVATTLLVTAHPHLRRHRLPRAAGQRPADHRLPDDPGQRQPARRQPRDDGRVGRDAAREAVLDDLRHHVDQLDAAGWATPRSRCSSISTATSTRPRRTCRRRSRGRRGSCRRTCRRRRRYQKVNPADSPILFLTLSSATLPLSDVNEYAETVIAQRISMVKGVAQVQRLRRAEVRGAHRRRSAAAGARGRSASTRSRRRSRAATSTGRPARSSARPRLRRARPTAS